MFTIQIWFKWNTGDLNEKQKKKKKNRLLPSFKEPSLDLATTTEFNVLESQILI